MTPQSTNSTTPPVTTQNRGSSEQDVTIQEAEAKVREAETLDRRATTTMRVFSVLYVVVTALVVWSSLWSNQKSGELRSAEKLLNDLQKEKIRADSIRKTEVETQKVREEAANELKIRTEEVRGEASVKIERTRGEAESRILEARAEAERKIGEVQKEVASQQARAAEAERRLLEVQNRLAWRHSFDEYKFRDVLESRPRGRAEIVYLKDDAEAAIFADSIWSALAMSGWDVDQPLPGKDNPESRMPFFLREAGVLVSNMPQLAVAVSSEAELASAPFDKETPADALMAAFAATDFEPFHEVLSEGMRPASKAIKIVVGSRF